MPELASPFDPHTRQQETQSPIPNFGSDEDEDEGLAGPPVKPLFGSESPEEKDEEQSPPPPKPGFADEEDGDTEGHEDSTPEPEKTDIDPDRFLVPPPKPGSNPWSDEDESFTVPSAPDRELIAPGELFRPRELKQIQP
jgi:hypothetical protein